MMKLSDEISGEWDDSERDIRRPFIHKFKNEKYSYVYDVNTDQIIQVSPVVYDIVNDFGVLSISEMVEKYGPQYNTVEEIRKAYETIETANREEGLFSNNHPREIRYPIDEQSLRLIYDEELNSLCLGVTEQCNLRCTYCGFSGTYKGNRVHNSTYMSFDVARRGLDFLKQHSTLSDGVILNFYGGEPLLNASLIKQCVEYANKIFGRKPVYFYMTTNATLLNDEICKMLIDNDFSIVVSIDGPKEMHNRYRVDRANKGSFDRIEHNLKKLQDLDLDYYKNNVKFNSVLPPPYDFEALNDFFSNFPLADVFGIRTSPVVAQGPAFYDRFSEEELKDSKGGFERLKAKYRQALIGGKINHEKPDQEHKFMLALFESPFVNSIPTMTPKNPFPEVYHPGGICIPGQRRFLLTPKGDFYTCEKSDTTSDLLRLGNLDTGMDAAKGITNIEAFSHCYDGCRYCYASRHCGVCFVEAYSDGKFDGNYKMAGCRESQTRFHQIIIDIMSFLEENPAALVHLKNVTLL